MLADEYNVSVFTVKDALRNRTWKSVKSIEKEK